MILVNSVLLVLLSAAAAGEQGPGEPMPSSQTPGLEHIEKGTLLLEVGLYNEAKEEFLAGLALAPPDATPHFQPYLERVRSAQARAETEQADKRSAKYSELGDALLERGRFANALTAYENAYEHARSSETQARAKNGINEVLTEQRSFWRSFYQDFVAPSAKAGLLGLIGVIAVGVLLLVFYWGLHQIGKSRAGSSSRIEVADFEDTTDTGLGKGFPALLKSRYHARVQLGRKTEQSNSGIVSYRKTSSDPPIMGSRKYEDFSEVTLEVGGIALAAVLAKVVRLVKQPRYSISGTVYRVNDEVHAAATLRSYIGVVESWDFVLTQRHAHGQVPSDSAYVVINALLNDLEQT